jgi:D-3-phosphoglycerate dehydrogenase
VSEPLNILITDELTTSALLKLRQIPKSNIVLTERYPEENKLRDADILIIRSRTTVDEALLTKAPNLKFIVTATSGTDHIDFSGCEKRGIKIQSTPEAQSQSAAEMTLFLMLSTLRRAAQVQHIMRQYLWKDSVLKGQELEGKIVGIIGLGRVGSRVAKLVQAFGATVLAHDPYQSDEAFKKLNIQRLGLTEVFVQSQILTFHVPLTEETRHMLTAQTLSMLQDDAIVINTSRGSVVAEGDLLRALESGSLLAAGLDVFESEPLGREARLRKLKNVVLTPHIGAYTVEAFDRASNLAADKVIDYLKQL